MNATTTTTTTDGNVPSNKTEFVTRILLNSLQVYGSILAIGLVLYCWLRKQIPRTFAVRQWVPSCQTTLANNSFGYFSWLWKVYSFSEDDLMEHVALDAVCFLRVINLGFRLSCVGCLCSILLIPVYVTSSQGQMSSILVDDPVQYASAANLPRKSPRFAASVIAAYIFFGYTMYSILKDFRWFIAKRHGWLQRFCARNYTILVRNLPDELRTDSALKKHFEGICGAGRVLEAHVCLHITNLQKLVKKRADCIWSLEHALAELAMKGKRIKHLVLLKAVGNAVRRGEQRQLKVDAIDHFTKELQDLNQEIDQLISSIEQSQRPKLFRDKTLQLERLPTKSSIEDNMNSSIALESENYGEEVNALLEEGKAEGKSAKLGTAENPFDLKEIFDPRNIGSNLINVSTSIASNAKTAITQTPDLATTFATQTVTTVTKTGKVMKDKTVKNAKKKMKQAQETVTAASGAVVSVLIKEEDGTPDSAGFVTFTSLAATHCALQMLQHSEPFIMQALPAPDEPDHLFWNNIGKGKDIVETGRLISAAATIAICIFWTPLVALIVQLKDLDSKQAGAESETPSTGNRVLAVLSPLILIVVNSGILPIILKALSRLEYPLSESLLESSAFWKMSAFTIIQTFLVTLLSGALIDNLSKIFETPVEFVNLLAKDLLSRSGYFIQILIVSSSLGMLMELFRVFPLFQSVLRANLGQRLTEKERNRRMGFLRPLSVPDKVYFSRLQARYPLYFLVLFVYSVFSPLVSWFCLVFFMFAGSVYRYQFVFNYPKIPDSGGTVWLYGMRVLLSCLLMSQLIILSVLFRAEATIIGYSMLPLFVITCIFINNLHTNYFQIGTNLPAHMCLNQDLENLEDSADFSVFTNQFKNPALLARFVDADWNAGKNEA